MTSPAVPLDPEELLADSRWLKALARGLVRDHFAADDLAQEAWLAALRAKADGSAAGVPHRAWLTGVLRNVAWKKERAERRRTGRERRGAKDEALPSTGELVARAEMQRELSDAVVALDEPFRTTILLRYLEELSNAEIARRQSVPEGTVRWRVMRGLELLRAELEHEKGGEWLHSCALLAGIVRWPEATAVSTAAAAGTSVVSLKAATVLVTGVALAGGGVVLSTELSTPSTDALIAQLDTRTAGGGGAPVPTSTTPAANEVAGDIPSEAETEGDVARATHVRTPLAASLPEGPVETSGATSERARTIATTKHVSLGLRAGAFGAVERPTDPFIAIVARKETNVELDGDSLELALTRIGADGTLPEEARVELVAALECALQESGGLHANGDAIPAAVLGALDPSFLNDVQVRVVEDGDPESVLASFDASCTGESTLRCVVLPASGCTDDGAPPGLLFGAHAPLVQRSMIWKRATSVR